MRRGFTLIELLAVVAIIGLMVTAGVVSYSANRTATRKFAAARDVMAMIRRARSVALVTQKPVLMTYSNAKSADGEETMAKVEMKSERLFSSGGPSGPVQTLSGELVETGIDETPSGDEIGDGGETLEDTLSPQTISEDVVKGIVVKVTGEADRLEGTRDERKKSKISIFSTVDGLSHTYGGESGETPEAEEGSSPPDAGDPLNERTSVTFAVNGTVEPAHRVYLYPEGGDPEQGLCIVVDRFGEPRCVELEGL